MKIKYIVGMIYLLVFVQSLHSMNLLEEPVPCIPVVGVNIVPGVIEPIGIGCTQNGIAVLEKDAFTVWNMKEKINVIHQTGQMYDFAVNREGALVALSCPGYFVVYDACSGKKQWHKGTGCPDGLPISFNHKDQVVTYSRSQHQSFIYSQFQKKGIRWPDVSLEANDLFAHHPLRPHIIFGVCCEVGRCGNYEEKVHSKFSVSFSDDCFVVGQLYDSDGSGAAIIGHGIHETDIDFVSIDSGMSAWVWPKYIEESMMLPKLCVAMAFHPNNKLFFLLDESNRIDCFDYVTKKCIHSMCCKGQERISVNGLEKRLALSRDGAILYAALKDKVIQIPLNDREQLFFMLSALMLYEHNNDLLPHDVVRIIMYNALKVSNAPLWSYLEK